MTSRISWSSAPGGPPLGVETFCTVQVSAPGDPESEQASGYCITIERAPGLAEKRPLAPWHWKYGVQGRHVESSAAHVPFVAPAELGEYFTHE